MQRYILSIIFYVLSMSTYYSQSDSTDLLSILGADETTIDYTTASFKTNRVINLHSLENTAGGVFDFKISHRFGFVSGGINELFGLDQASIRIGGDYGITDRFTIGFGRSSFQKTYDFFSKYKFLRQSTGKKKMPLTAALLTTAAINSAPWEDPARENYFSSRLSYTWQLILGRKFSDNFTLQLSPTIVHRNLVTSNSEKNDIYAIGSAARLKLSKRTSFNAEYVYLLPDRVAADIQNSLSIGFDIETGGHVFQLHFTNSTSMIENGFIANTVGKWADGDVHFGFNVSRVFTFKEKK
jgi:hypothetical protein